MAFFTGPPGSLTGPSLHQAQAPLPPRALIVPRSTRPDYPRLPRLHNFSARVVSVFASSEITIVFKIYWNHAFHILKLYQPPQEGIRRAFHREYTAYACLEQSPPSCVPRCYGFANVRTKNLRFSKRLARSRGYDEVRKRERWRGLVLEFIPHTLSLDTYLEQGICDGLKAKVVASLVRLHESGVVHSDTVGRNCLVQRVSNAEQEKRNNAVKSEQNDAVGSEPGFRIWWIDFDSALTTGGYEIPERVFWREATRMEEVMRGEVTIYSV